MIDHPDWWDPYSNQPHKLPRDRKPRLDTGSLLEYLKTALTVIGTAPAVAWKYSRPPLQNTTVSMDDFAGLSISPDPAWQSAMVEMVDEIRVKNILLRAPTWRMPEIENLARLIELFPGRQFLVNILQSADSVRNPGRWQRQLYEIFETLSPQCKIFQIGNAINRTKWGCRHSGEALQLFHIADQVRSDFDGIKLLGSSVIDFEPIVQLRTLFNFSGYKMDGCASQLYINRRGSAYEKQYRIFDLERKIRLNYALLGVSNNSGKKLWITETNWPLLYTKPYTPNSGHPRSTVDEDTQAEYLKQYYEIAHHTGMVEKVFWWQLINPGYGLVDHRSGKLRKMPSYYAFKSLFTQEG